MFNINIQSTQSSKSKSFRRYQETELPVGGKKKYENQNQELKRVKPCPTPYN